MCWKWQRKKAPVIYKGKSTRIRTDFSIEYLNPRRTWTNTFQFLKDDDKPRLWYSVKLSVIIERERKTYHAINCLKLITITFDLQYVLPMGGAGIGGYPNRHQRSFILQPMERDEDPHSDTRWSLGNPADVGRKDCRSKRDQGYHRKTHRIN